MGLRAPFDRRDRGQLPQQPAALFRRRRLTVEEIVARYDDLQAGPLAGKQVILTVSPVRHLGDGLPDNF